MLLHLLLIFATAALFYLAVPGIGAFVVRAQWRTFRTTINEISRFPTLNPRVLGRRKDGFIGCFRFFGTLEAMQGDDRIWITDGTLSAAVDLRRVSVYMLPAAPSQDQADTELGTVPWSRIFTLPEGTTILVGGALFGEDGRGVFRTRDRRRPLVVIHDCKKEQIVQRAIWGGRQRNEYWNPFTLPSIITGSFSLFTLSYALLGNPDQRIPALLGLAMSLAPMSPFLPPAFPMYFLYRHFWKKARLMRAQRDSRPRRAALLPDLEPYIMLSGEQRPGRPHEILCAGESVRLPEETKRILLSLPPRSARRISGADAWHAFGAYSDDGNGIELKRPDDPMAELILLPGNPERIAGEYDRVARFYEIVSAFFIALTGSANMTAILLILSRLIP
jgi:hypothetical protein